jgi:hypothetical protein
MKYLIIILLLIVNVIANKCPRSAPEALYSENRPYLLECDAKTLRKYYNANSCCISNIAECEYIAVAYELRRNILQIRPLCPNKFIRGVW